MACAKQAQAITLRNVDPVHQRSTRGRWVNNFLFFCLQHMVQNQMNPSYPQFATQTGIEEYQQNAAVAVSQQTPAAAVTDPAAQAQFKEQQVYTQAAITANGVEQQTVSIDVCRPFLFYACLVSSFWGGHVSTVYCCPIYERVLPHCRTAQAKQKDSIMVENDHSPPV